MAVVDVVLKSNVPGSFRVSKVRGQFDLAAGNGVAAFHLHAELPIEQREWKLGLITGASGTGKSSIARELFGLIAQAHYPWSADHAIVDDFPDALSPAEITQLLTSVGFGSPPAWLRPYHVLSTGQQHRADLARALAGLNDEAPVVFDEFTSTVDRTVAKAVCVAISRTMKRAKVGSFVAVTCHKDVAAWLQPDWVYDTDRAEFTWGSVQPRPRVRLVVRAGSRSAWQTFRGHHYLSGDLHRSSRVFLAYVELGDEPPRLAGFFSLLPVAGHKGWWRGHRTVVLPDFQGLGIGNRMIETVAEQLWRRERKRFRAVTSAPALVQHRLRHPEMWRLASGPKMHAPQGRTSTIKGHVKTAAGRLSTSWVYLPEGLRDSQ